jgi:hypothetical protein
MGPLLALSFAVSSLMGEAFAKPPEGKSCGEARLVAGKKCESLYVVFDYAGCDEAPMAPVIVRCESAGAIAETRGERHEYRTRLTIVGDSWVFAQTRLVQTKIIATRTPAETTPISAGTGPAPTSTPSSTAEPVRNQNLSAPELDVTGTFRWRIENAAAVGYAPALAASSTSSLRLRARLSYRPNGRATYVLTPQVAKIAGGDILAPATETTNESVTTSGATRDPSLLAHEGYLIYDWSSSFKTLIGRQEIRLGDDLVVGPSNWNLIGRSFDALRLQVAGDRLRFDLFFSKISDAGTTDEKADDTNFHGAYLAFAGRDWYRSLDVYALLKETLASDARLITAGLRWVAQPGLFFLRAESNNQSGVVGLENAFFFSSDFGVKGAGGLDFLFKFDRAGANYDTLYGSGHSHLGIADLIGRKNQTSRGASLRMNWSDSFATQIDVFDFQRTDTNTAAFTERGAALGAMVNTEASVGRELDIVINYRHAEMEVELGAARFEPGDYLLTQASDWNQPLDYLYLQMSSAF